ncbi:phenylacetic acid degradation bifunctional protein PaaZ [Aureispira anguillae]|uniref:Phenylacetic acid degradation bifunctional protein PaaZ n=1 Tax=Aureispira anguillae TaxID=2864201 RepID=A0A915YAI2_9BACT|nr:phenylacetic acid degradation bifunctional protein PaaZ [Aureispira anguillae]BDS09737.1 phenylacetic acid degradation bifunctional protein PaaZ [Aureispira anguillae]
MANKLDNYILGQWTPHDGAGITQYNAVTGDVLSTVNGDGMDFASILDYGRKVGNKNLRTMTFLQRGLMLKKLALFLHKNRKKYYPISYLSGATKTDSWIDIDGGIGTLFAYASLRKKFSDQPYYVDGEMVGLSKEGTFVGHHIMVPKAGVAVHINAFNFPIWGMLEKLAVNLLAGMPAVVKPAEQTSYLTQAMVKDIIASGILPEGALQLVCGSGIGILDTVNAQDVVTFTGSAHTGRMLKGLPHIINEAVTFNMEADSLNCSILGPDATPDTEEFKLFIKEVHREMTVKTGQKCTAIRRIIVPENLVEEVQFALSARLQKTTIGDPQVEGVRMGSLASHEQLNEVLKSAQLLSEENELVYGSFERDFEVIGADVNKGAFLAPMLFLNDSPFQKQQVHSIEAFGPISTIMPYKGIEEAIELANMGKGSLVSSITTYDDAIARQYVLGAATHHGRILVLNRESAAESTGHGSPMPLMSHGGPGRAGGGEEMGGLRGVKHYLQRTALQGTPTTLTHLTGVYQYGAKGIDHPVHPFRKHFEELKVGEQWITAKHTVTVADIVNFANVSGDHFYAHTDETALDGTIFEGRVAHGYWVLAKAAGLFVEAKKGPVLLNYGLDECRFTKPVYPGMTIGVKFTVKEKVDQEKKSEDDIAKGIVKFMVDVYDETGETCALATILTMVRKLDQDGEVIAVD